MLSRYVVGQFGAVIKSSAMTDPFEIATAYDDSALIRNFGGLLNEVEVASRRV
jgi:hypothetical protein